MNPGAELGAARIGVLASLAVAHPVVYRRPRVALLGSGDEIVDVDQPEEILSGRKVASSNTHTLIALVRLAGGLPVNLGIARDSPASLREHLGLALDCDLLVTTAGISVGEHDYVKAVLEELGAELRFWKLRMRPGAPVGFGLIAGARGSSSLPWIGLPGNPVSTMVTFELFVRPAIRKMMGHELPFRRATRVRLAEPITLAGLAAVAGWAPAHFSTVFRRQTQTTPLIFLTRLRLQRACELLKGTDAPLAEIGAQVGFPDPFYFSRVFSRHQGLAPAAYRRLYASRR